MPGSTPKTIHLPPKEQVLLEQLLQNEKNIRLLHPLLELLQEPEREASSLVQALLAALMQISEELRLSREQHELSQQQAARLEQKLDHVLDILNLPAE